MTEVREFGSAQDRPVSLLLQLEEDADESLSGFREEKQAHENKKKTLCKAFLRFLFSWVGLFILLSVYTLLGTSGCFSCVFFIEVSLSSGAYFFHKMEWPLEKDRKDIMIGKAKDIDDAMAYIVDRYERILNSRHNCSQAEPHMITTFSADKLATSIFSVSFIHCQSNSRSNPHKHQNLLSHVFTSVVLSRIDYVTFDQWGKFNNCTVYEDDPLLERDQGQYGQICLNLNSPAVKNSPFCQCVWSYRARFEEEVSYKRWAGEQESQLDIERSLQKVHQDSVLGPTELVNENTYVQSPDKLLRHPEQRRVQREP